MLRDTCTNAALSAIAFIRAEEVELEVLAEPFDTLLPGIVL